MKLQDLQNKKVAFLGLGIENQALIKFLIAKKVDCQITILDKRPKSTFGLYFQKFKFQTGKNYDQKLDSFEIIFRSPGYPLFSQNIQKAQKKKAVISSPIKIFFDLCPTKNIIGVSGTKGKGTTASLIYAILKKAGKQAFLAGNIGLAPFSFFNKLTKNSWLVLELSSFHLEDLNLSPKIAVLTNFFPEHLQPADPNNPNYHKSLENYFKAKLNLDRFQSKDGYFVVNKSLKPKINKLKIKSKIKYFDKVNYRSRLAGDYNQENIAAAASVVKILKIKDEIVKEAVKNFKPLEHHLELVREARGVKYYDNSFSTTPESSILDLKSFDRPIILLAGGADKGSNFKNFSKTIKNRVKFLILFKGQGSEKIKKELVKLNFPSDKLKIVKSMKEAVKLATKYSKSGEVVLLSTGCASFGIFKNYKDRGNQFKQCVKKV